MQHHLYAFFIRLPKPIRILTIAMTVIIFFGIIISFIEPDTFPSIFDGIWWAIITASTVGYGDFAPKTVFGRTAGIILILFGAGFLSAFLVSIATSAVTKQSDFLKGKAEFKGKKHTIIIGWNERSRDIITKLLKQKDKSSIVLIDQTLKHNPINDIHVQYIHGRPTEDQVLMKANIDSADKVLITADQNKGEKDADMHTVLTLLTIKGINPDVICIAEILTTEQVVNAIRAGADEIIQSNKITSSVMMNTLLKSGAVEPLINLLEQLDGTKIAFRASTPFIGKTFQETSKALLEENIVLIGVKRGFETMVIPENSYQIKEGDLLFIIKSN